MNSFIPKAPAKQATAPGFGASHLLSTVFFFGLLLHSFLRVLIITPCRLVHRSMELVNTGERE